MADAYIGEIRAFGFNYAPEDWAFCNGQLLNIAQYSALFSLLGITFGGDGSRTFGVPNLQARALMGTGMGPGLTARNLGDTPGAPTVTLAASQMPPHNHTLNAVFPASTGLLVSEPTAGARLSYEDRLSPAPITVLYAYSNTAAPNTTLAPQSVSPSAETTGPHVNTQPYQVLNFCICLNGNWPPQP